jgi:hypothetical protein
MNRAVIVLALCVAAAAAQPKFTAPLVGVARDSRQQCRLIHGTAGNFVLSAAIGDAALDCAFDASGGLVRTQNELLVLDATGAVTRSLSAASGNVLLSPQNAYFPATGGLWQIGPRIDRRIPVELEAIAGTVMALGPANAGSLPLAVCRATQLWLLAIDETTGLVTRQTAEGGAIGAQACHPAGALLVLADRLLLSTAQEVLVQTAAGLERRIAVPETSAAQPTIRRAGEQWVQVEMGGSLSLMIRIATGGEELYQLPAAPRRQ